MLLINSYISESFSFNIEKSSLTYFTSDSYLVQFSKKQEAPFQRSALINIRYFNEQEIINGRHIMNLKVFFIHIIYISVKENRYGGVNLLVPKK